MRNERARVDHWLDHYRRLGAAHFLIVDNDSTDGTAELLSRQSDVSVWSTKASYREARFGVDWLTGLQWTYGAGRWCLTVDADEILIYPDWKDRPLSALTGWLDQSGAPGFAAMMLDLYPKGPLGNGTHSPGQDPLNSVPWFDAWGYTWESLPRRGIYSIRGGPRKRVFFADMPDHAPHLHKIPLVKWRRSYVYLSSTHDLLPRSLNGAFDARNALPTGVLLHSKFLDGILEKSVEEKQRREHFTHPDDYASYYDQITNAPDLWYEQSCYFEGADQLERLGLMRRGDWPEHVRKSGKRDS